MSSVANLIPMAAEARLWAQFWVALPRIGGTVIIPLRYVNYMGCMGYVRYVGHADYTHEVDYVAYTDMVFLNCGERLDCMWQYAKS